MDAENMISPSKAINSVVTANDGTHYLEIHIPLWTIQGSLRYILLDTLVLSVFLPLAPWVRKMTRCHFDDGNPSLLTFLTSVKTFHLHFLWWRFPQHQVGEAASGEDLPLAQSMRKAVQSTWPSKEDSRGNPNIETPVPYWFDIKALLFMQNWSDWILYHLYISL